MWPDFSYSGSANKFLYFTQDWSSDSCKAVSWATKYSATDRDAYKKCVCIEKIGVDSPNCQQADPEDDPKPEPEPESESEEEEEPKPEPESESECEFDCESEEEEKPKPEPESDSEEEPKPEPESESEEEPKPEPESESELTESEEEEEEPSEDENVLDELKKMIKAIKDKPHYSETEKSRTTWQVDETLDYVSEKLYLIEQAFRANNLIQ